MAAGASSGGWTGVPGIGVPLTRARERPGVVDAVVAAVGPSNCLTDPELCAPYETDWTRRWHGRAALVARPTTRDQVAAVVAACTRHRIAVVPQGGNTGLVGGSVPRSGEVLISLAHLDQTLVVDPVANLLEADAGVTLARAQAAAAEYGLGLGIDLAARDTATLGGMAATNAGGIHVLRYGAMRARLAGLEAVMADGSVLSRTSGAAKDNVGYDLVGLLAGSEGTLGVITRVLVRLAPLPPWRVTAIIALRPLPGAGGPVAAAVALVNHLLRQLDGLEAAELFFAEGVELVRQHASLPPPLGASAEAFLLVEVAGRTDPLEAVSRVLVDHPLVLDTAASTDAAGRVALWAYRERHTEAIAAQGLVHKLDVCLPIRDLADFWAEVIASVRRWRPQAQVICFGHVGEGNLHINILGLEADDTEVDALVLGLVLAHGGSISGEHGVGVAKRSLVGQARGPVDLGIMKALKDALDPHGLFNPGVLFPTRERGGSRGGNRTFGAMGEFG